MTKYFSASYLIFPLSLVSGEILFNQISSTGSFTPTATHSPFYLAEIGNGLFVLSVILIFAAILANKCTKFPEQYQAINRSEDKTPCFCFSKKPYVRSLTLFAAACAIGGMATLIVTKNVYHDVGHW